MLIHLPPSQKDHWPVRKRTWCSSELLSELLPWLIIIFLILKALCGSPAIGLAKRMATLDRCPFFSFSLC
jgi:hypothetical protein